MENNSISLAEAKRLGTSSQPIDLEGKLKEIVFLGCALRFVEQADGSIVLEVLPEEDALAGREPNSSCSKKMDPKTQQWYCTEGSCTKTCCAEYDWTGLFFSCKCK
jgi:hypothetical protein